MYCSIESTRKSWKWKITYQYMYMYMRYLYLMMILYKESKKLCTNLVKYCFFESFGQFWTIERFWTGRFKPVQIGAVFITLSNTCQPCYHARSTSLRLHTFGQFQDFIVESLTLLQAPFWPSAWLFQNWTFKIPDAITCVCLWLQWIIAPGKLWCPAHKTWSPCKWLYL